MKRESAGLGFGRMYGMVKEFAEHADYYAGIFAVNLVSKIVNAEKKNNENTGRCWKNQRRPVFFTPM